MSQARARPAALTIAGRCFEWGRCSYVVGIINVSPDSFSGDGLRSTDEAVRQAVAFASQGADVLDIGGESTRPGFSGISADEEISRVIPAIERISREVDVPLSVDTYKAAVAREALDAGAHLVNDIWGFRHDPEMATLCAQRNVPAIIMHNQRGREFHDVVADILAGWRESIAIATAAGIERSHLIVDPGFGFGWEVEQNVEMLRRLRELTAAGLPILVGTSRKSTLGELTGREIDQRLSASLASVAIAIANGADLVRVHDVAATVDVCRVSDAIVRGDAS
ncbi:MAG TPA: dihydropteroate synthase [Dehalococcoidia bacterium]|nr:dihydropteroate synthase [Dehalococcoidia bacterium]